MEDVFDENGNCILEEEVEEEGRMCDIPPPWPPFGLLLVEPAEEMLHHARSRCEVDLLARILKLGLQLDVLFTAHAAVLRDNKVITDAWALATDSPDQLVTASVPILGRSKVLAERRVEAVSSRLQLAFESLAEEAALLNQQVQMNTSLVHELRTAGHTTLADARSAWSSTQRRLLVSISNVLQGNCALPPQPAPPTFDA